MSHGTRMHAILTIVMYNRKQRPDGAACALTVLDIELEIERKNVRSVRISVLPPDGRVRVSAPASMALETVRSLVASKLGWIKKKQIEVRGRPMSLSLSYITGELVPLWGEYIPLVVEESTARSGVTLADGVLHLRAARGSDRSAREKAVYAWYRKRLIEAVEPLLEKWEPIAGRKPASIAIRRMKSKWGSCNALSGRVCLNLELVKAPPDCLEYVLVHELTHLLEASHNARFKRLLSSFLPDWKKSRDRLNGKSRK